MVTREALRIAHEKATFIGTINRSFDDSFGKTGAKIGDTLRIRLPNQYVRTQGSRVMSVQDQNESSVALTVATQDHVDMRLNSAERALSIDDFSARYIEPAMAQLMGAIDGDMLVAATKATFNTAGTAGTVVGTVTSGFSDTTALGIARAKMNQGLAPKDQLRSAQFDSITMASVANGVKGLFNPTGQISDAFREGFIARNAMADWYENERTWTLTNSGDVSGSTDNPSLVTDGGIIVDFHTNISVANSVVGSVFTIAGVYACHPETKQAYSHLQQFVVTSLNAASVNVQPTIYLGLSAATAAKQNVCKSDGTKLALTDFNAQVCTFIGVASTSYRQNLMYHRDAFAFVTADLPLMDGAEKCVRRTQDGISLRVWEDGDIRNDELLMRIDILYGFAAIRPYWASRITN
jgi:hypothetical protein